MKYKDFVKNRMFDGDASAIEFLIEQKIIAVRCPKCKHVKKVYHRKTRLRKAYCNGCLAEFSLFTGTIFEDSDTEIRKWLYAVLEFDNLKKLGKSKSKVVNLGKEIDVTYKTAKRIIECIDDEHASKRADLQKQIRDELERFNRPPEELYLF